MLLLLLTSARKVDVEPPRVRWLVTTPSATFRRGRSFLGQRGRFESAPAEKFFKLLIMYSSSSSPCVVSSQLGHSALSNRGGSWISKIGRTTNYRHLTTHVHSVTERQSTLTTQVRARLSASADSDKATSGQTNPLDSKSAKFLKFAAGFLERDKGKTRFFLSLERIPLEGSSRG